MVRRYRASINACTVVPLLKITLWFIVQVVFQEVCSVIHRGGGGLQNKNSMSFVHLNTYVAQVCVNAPIHCTMYMYIYIHVHV